MAHSDKLVKLYKENIIMLESSMAHEIWAKIKTIINKLVQWRNKLYNFRSIYAKKQKRKIQKQSVPHLFSKTTTVWWNSEFQEVVNMLEIKEADQVGKL